jgi:hypothetical protein
MNIKYRAAQTVLLSVLFLLFASVSLANAQEDDAVLRPALGQGLRFYTPVTVTSFLSVTQSVAAIHLAAVDAAAAPEATITVQSAADTGVANAGNCPGTGCRLRDAIAAAASGDTLTFAGDYTINLAGSQLSISKNLTIDGAGHTITINGPGASCTTCFRVLNIAGGYAVTLNALTMSNGKPSDRFGGGIFNAGTLTVTNSTFSGNSAAWGGGLQNSGVLTVINSTFSANTATSGGAGLESGGGNNTPAITALIVNSTFANNIAYDVSGIGTGGGIQLDGGILNLANVTLANNQANGTADDGGGGLMIYFGAATIRNSTIAENTTTNTRGEAAGISVNRYTGSATLGLYNTIVDQSGLDCSQTNGGTITADSANLDSDGTCDNASTSTAINLSPLADNGGSTQTFALLPNSPAIDAGAPATCAATPINNLDQRGQPRSDLQCDLGAFELEYADSPTVQRAVSSAVATTFGPALMGIQRDAGFTDPGVIVVTKYSGSTHGPDAIGAAWAITPTTTSGLSLTLKLCYTPSELGSLTESNLRLWRLTGSTWVQVGGTPAFSTVGSNGCAQVSGITTGGGWTLATSAPTAVTLNYFTATKSDDHNAIAWETASELDNLGFNLWRGTSPAAPDVKLNAYVIPSQAPGGTDGFAYSYDDFDIASETVYYYWLEDVDLRGQVTRHSPVLATAGNIPNAVTLITLQANSHAVNRSVFIVGALGATAALLLIKRRRVS